MGTVVGTVEDCREMFDVSAQTNQIRNPVAYKLVRVSGDGRLVPATDEEILEVNETDMHYVSDACQSLSYLPAEGSPSRFFQLEETSEVINLGLLRSDNVELSTDLVTSHPEYSEELLQKVEQDETVVKIHGSHMLSTPSDANIKCCNENKMSDEDQVHHEALLPFSSDVQNGCDVNQSNTVEPCSASSPKETALPAADAARKPDFSLVRGEICLDNLTIKALQETFRATFGRETTVKDKTWLKRRITMGLTKSVDIPTTYLTIKDNKLVGYQVKSNDVADVFSKDMGDDVKATNLKDAPSSSAEDFSCEERAAKRVRKPTRRYIEELSETDEKQHNDKSVSPSTYQRLSEKSEVRSMSVSSGKRVTVTRVVPLGGSEVEVPYVSHVRRSRPRENIMALMECHTSCFEAKASAGGESNLLNSEVVSPGSVVESASGPIQKEFATSHNNNNEEEHILAEADQDMEPELVDSSGNSSDDYNNTGAPMMQGGGLRRKHHRAWTLSEVTKLVEGVSKYGAGKWSEIKKLSFSSHSHRTSVDLKDKWRNLLRASFAQNPSNSMGSSKKHGSMHIPMEILLQVRELAEKQSLVPPNHR